jgi:Domain of unknown function (DUF5348)
VKRCSPSIRDQNKKYPARKYRKGSMGRLIVHQKDGLLELDGFLLQVGDRVEIRLIGSWVPGTIAHDRQGWYFLTPDQVGIRLQTGLFARLLSLSSESLYR